VNEVAEEGSGRKPVHRVRIEIGGRKRSKVSWSAPPERRDTVEIERGTDNIEILFSQRKTREDSKIYRGLGEDMGEGRGEARRFSSVGTGVETGHLWREGDATGMIIGGPDFLRKAKGHGDMGGGTKKYWGMGQFKRKPGNFLAERPGERDPRGATGRNEGWDGLESG